MQEKSRKKTKGKGKNGRTESDTLRRTKERENKEKRN